MVGAKATLSEAERLQARTSVRNAWALSAPALILLFCAAAGPLLIVLIYSFLAKGDYGGVSWQFSWDGWYSSAA